MMAAQFACSKPSGTILAEAKKLSSQKKWEEADLQFRKVLQTDPSNVEARLEFGKSLFAQGKGAEAYREFEEALRLAPENPEARRLFRELSLALYLRDPQRPVERYRQLAAMAESELSKDPNSFDGWRIKGLLAQADRRTPDAIEAFRNALKVKPLDADITRQLARTLAQDSARGAEAEALWTSLIQSNPKDGGAYVDLAEFFKARKDMAKAESVLREAAKNASAMSVAHFRLAQFLWEQGRRDEAKELVESRLARDAQQPEALLQAGDFYFEVKDWDAALAHYQSGWKQSTERRAEYGKRVVRVLNALGRMEEARRVSAEVLQLAPKDLELRTAQALLEMERKQPAEAVDLLTKLIAEHPGNPTLHYHLGRAHLQAGQMEKAIAQWRESLRLAPAATEPRLELARLALQAGRLPEALEGARTVLLIEPSQPEALHLRVAALQAMGQWPEARKALDEFRQLHPGVEAIELDEAYFHIKDGKHLEAARIFKKYYRPGSADLHRLGGYSRALVGGGKAAEALQLVQNEVQLVPKNPALQYILAETYLVNGKREEARATLETLRASDPSFFLAGMRLGSLYLEEGKTQEAVRILDSTAKASPDRQEPIALLAQAQLRAGDWAAAKTSYRAALKKDERSLAATVGLARVIAKHGAENELAEALRLALSAKSAMPQNPQIIDTLGLVYLRRNERPAAIQEFRTAIRLAPGNQNFKEHLAQALRN